MNDLFQLQQQKKSKFASLEATQNLNIVRNLNKKFNCIDRHLNITKDVILTKNLMMDAHKYPYVLKLNNSKYEAVRKVEFAKDFFLVVYTNTNEYFLSLLDLRIAPESLIKDLKNSMVEKHLKTSINRAGIAGDNDFVLIFYGNRQTCIFGEMNDIEYDIHKKMNKKDQNMKDDWRDRSERWNVKYGKSKLKLYSHR